MSPTHSRRRAPRRVVVAALTTAAALATAGALVAADPAQADPAAKQAPTKDLQLLAINDFHGNLEPPAGSSGRVTEVQPDGTTANIDAGGVEYLASSLRTARKGHDRSLTVAAGDIVGASPLLSGLFHDEPTVEAMNKLGLDVTGVGNHEFDEGKDELLRLQNGGCHPVDGCYAEGRKFKGADYPILSANVTNEKTGKPLLKPYVVQNVKGAKVGFIGVTLKGTPDVVTAEGVKGLKFLDEAETINKYTKELQKQGVHAIVALVHEGGFPASSAYNYDCDAGGSTGLSGPIVDIAKKVSPEVDALVTGHTHNAYVCTIPDPAGHPRLVTSAASFGRLYTELNMQYDPRTDDIVRATVKGSNRVVDRTQAKAADMTKLLDTWQTLAAPIANKPVGYITKDITRNGAVESSLGDLIADAQLAHAKSLDGSAVLALMNPGGIRTDLVYAASGNEGDGVVTYGEGFAVQPFANTVNLKDLTGAQLITVLKQQVSGSNAAAPKYLQISDGLTYTLDLTKTGADRVVTDSIRLNGKPIDPTATYRVAMNSFLAGGGDGFTELANGTNQLVGSDDLAALVDYLTANSSTAAPYAPTAADRITVIR